MGIFDKIRSITMSISSFFIAAGTILVFVNSMLRYLFASPIPWIDELSTLLMVLLVFIFQINLESKDDQLTIDILKSRLKSPLGKKLIRIVRAAVTIIIYLLLADVGLNVVKQNYSVKSFTPVLELPVYIINSIVVAVMFIIAVIWAFNLFYISKEGD